MPYISLVQVIITTFIHSAWYCLVQENDRKHNRLKTPGRQLPEKELPGTLQVNSFHFLTRYDVIPKCQRLQEFRKYSLCDLKSVVIQFVWYVVVAGILGRPRVWVWPNKAPRQSLSPNCKFSNRTPRPIRQIIPLMSLTSKQTNSF